MGTLLAVHPLYQSGGWQSLRRPRSKVDFKNCDFSKKWRYSIVIRLKYVSFYKSHIEATGRPAVRQNVCAQKMKIYKLKLAKNRIFLKIEKMPQKIAFLEVLAFQKWENSIRHFSLY